ncbi:MAG: transcription termination factor Rho, partial [Solirubrobacterales bacterium]
SDGDVYVSAAQVRRCELVSGDRVTGPVRSPRRSERYPSLVRVETINDRPADEVADGTPYEKLGAAFPAAAIALDGSRPALALVAERAPIGRGSRVTVSGPFGSGRTLLLRELAGALAAEEGIEVSVVLAGARPEEQAEWQAAGIEPATVAALGSSQEAQSQALDRAVEAARRAVSRGGHCALVIDSLDGVSAAAARRALAAARNGPDGGSLTVVAASREPLGGETTVIVLDAEEGARAGHPGAARG